MRDKFGTFRGKCLDGCACVEFKAKPDGSSVRCSECNHTPVKHESFGIVGNCRGCTECKMFEASYGEFEFCEYCECALRQHCIQLKPAAVQVSGGGVQNDVVSISPIYTQQQQTLLQTGAGNTQYQLGATPQVQPINPLPITSFVLHGVSERTAGLLSHHRVKEGNLVALLDGTLL